MQAGYYVGGIVGIGTNTTICNCYVTGYLKGYFVSGIIGNATNCLIANCFSTAKVGGNYNGCISGYTVNSTITNCFFNKDIQGKSTSDIATPTSTHAFETGTITRRLNEYVEASDIPNLLHWTQDASADTIPQFSPATKYNDKEADGELKIFGIRKAIVVHSSNKRNLTVCDLTGKIIYNREIENGTIITIPVAKGIYIANGVKVIVTE